MRILKYKNDRKNEYLRWRRMRENQGYKPLTYLQWLDWKINDKGENHIKEMI